MSWLRLIVALGLCLVLMAAASAQQAQWNKLIEQAQKLHQQGKYSQAAPLAEQALKLAEKTFGSSDPRVGRTLFWLATIYESQGKYSEAETTV